MTRNHTSLYIIISHISLVTINQLNIKDYNNYIGHSTHRYSKHIDIYFESLFWVSYNCMILLWINTFDYNDTSSYRLGQGHVFHVLISLINDDKNNNNY